jgi:thioredoxin reductase (NADPH)
MRTNSYRWQTYLGITIITFFAVTLVRYATKPKNSFKLELLEKSENIIPVAVIGSGPAGLSAAVYGSRGKLNTVVFEGRQPGGQLTTTTWVENWPGITKTLGKEIIEGLRNQAKEFGAQFSSETIKSVDFSTWPYTLTTDRGVEIKALTVIISTGASPRKLEVPGEQDFWGKGVTTCAICDAPFYKDSDVVVVGGGDSAVEEAMQLAPYAKKITILVRGKAMRASPTMQDHLSHYDHVSIMYNTQISAIKGDVNHVNMLDLVVDGKNTTMPIDGVFLAIGHIPNTDIFGDQLRKDKDGYLILEPYTQETSKRGVFAAGDVADHRYRQAGVASGDGIKAALDAADFLRTIGFNEILSNQYAPKMYAAYNPQTTFEVPHLASAAEYEEKISRSNKLIVLDFYTEFCPSCLQMMPIYASVAEELQEKTEFYKVDAIAAKDLADQLVVPTVPTFLIIKDGNVIARSKEIMNKQAMTQFIKNYID